MADTKPAGVLSNVRRDADPPEFGDHSLAVVVLVGTQGLVVGTGEGSRHRLGGTRSPVPVACVTWQSTIRAWRLSMSTWPSHREVRLLSR
jgi:hypothetical protein